MKTDKKEILNLSAPAEIIDFETHEVVDEIKEINNITINLVGINITDKGTFYEENGDIHFFPQDVKIIGFENCYNVKTKSHSVNLLYIKKGQNES